jgi:hypothetical protein
VGLALAVFLILSSVSWAQQPKSADERMDQFEKRLADLERKYQSDLKAKDEEIARLKAQLQNPQPSTPATTPASVADDDHDHHPPPRMTPGINPNITIVSDFVGNISTRSSNQARNRFDLRAVELDLRAAVHPMADGVFIAPFAREIDDPLFFDPAIDQEGPETAVEIEEAYLHLHDFGVPNLAAKLGRFHLRFGRQNLLHAHDWPTVDNNFVNQSFLSAEALADAGLSVNYQIPLQQGHIDLIGEIISGEGGESPTLNNDASVQSPALNLHALWNRNLNPQWNLELGASFLTARHDNSSSLSTNLFGLDITLIHHDRSGGFNNKLLQAEMIYGITETSPTEKQQAFGAYILGQQQLHKDWYAGLRLDWTQDALDDTKEIYGISPYVTWFWSEYLRFRLEYQHRQGDVPDENTVYFQAIWIFGAHPRHSYWTFYDH